MGVVVEDLKKHFADAKRFDQDRVVTAMRGQRTAWMVAGLATGTAASLGLAIAMIMPLKTVEPYVIRVDNATGIVDVVSALSSEKTTYDAAVTKYFAGAYVRSREGFAVAEAESNFKRVSLLSAAEEQARFAAHYSGRNPESPQVIFGRSATSKITIASISMVTKSVASVRYLRLVTKGEDKSITHWVATVTFSYQNVPLSAADRLINPLGFVVSEYHADPEAIQ